MQRREFLTHLGYAAASTSLLAASAARAQQAKIWRVGIILAGTRTLAIEGFVQGMRELGYQAGRDYHAEWRFADGRYARFPVFAEDFVRLQVDVIFVETSAAVDLVRQVTRTIPIVMGYSIDPVGGGLVTSLTRPGGNVTGLAGSKEFHSPEAIRAHEGRCAKPCARRPPAQSGNLGLYKRPRRCGQPRAKGRRGPDIGGCAQSGQPCGGVRAIQRSGCRSPGRRR